MPNFESPISNKKFTSKPLAEYDVPDESEMNHFHQDPAEFEREIQAARTAKIAHLTGKERIGEGAKKRIEMLLNMSRLTRAVEIDGNVYIFQSLKAKEQREALVAIAEYDGTVQFAYECRKQFLARSLTSIGGISFEQFIGSTNLDDKFLFIEELDEGLANRLHREYNILVNETREKFSVKDDVDAQEVRADIKK
jgi:hypothetical protein